MLPNGAVMYAEVVTSEIDNLNVILTAAMVSDKCNYVGLC